MQIIISCFIPNFEPAHKLIKSNVQPLKTVSDHKSK